MTWLRTLDDRRVEFLVNTRRWWHEIPPWVRWTIILGFVVLLVFLPVLKPPLIKTPKSDFPSVLFSPIALYVLVAIGLNIVVGMAGMLDLGYVAFYAIGAYTVGVLTREHASLPYFAVVPIAIVFAMFAGVVLGAPTLRLRGDYLAIVTLGFGEVIRITANNINFLGAARGISGIPKPSDIGPLHFSRLNARTFYWLALVAIFIVVFIVRRLERSRVGRAWTAIREDEDAAELMGVPTFRFKLWAFAMGAAIGGLSGSLYATFAQAITPDTFQLLLSILFLAAVVLGGSGNLPGVIAGAVAIAYLPERFRGLQQTRVVWFGIALVVMMVFRPQGILPSRRRAEEIADPRSHPNIGGITEADVEAVEENENV
jgi:branched-chain amino acid transport system permease protein